MARDDFHKPKPRKAPVKAVVNGVLSAVSAMGTSLVSLLSGLLAAVLILYSGYVLYDTFYTQENAKSGWDLLQYKPVILEDAPAPEAGENRLAKINSDYRAWLTLYETNIDYPVMQGDNDLYYANHDIYKEVSLTGAIYLAAGNNGSITDSYNLIYGHHMDNGAMFGALDLFRDQSYFNAHREGLLVSRSAVYDLYAFAVAETDAYQNRIYAVGDRMDDLLTFLRANLTDADPDGADWSRDTTVPIFDEAPLDGATKIVALSTCAAANTNGRLVVFYVATLRNLITVNAQGSTWVYDGQAHTLQDLSDDGSGVYFTTNYPGDEQYPTTVEYSVDGGQTWTTTPPSVRDVAEVPVLVRATNPNYDTVEVTVLLRITPRIVTVTVGDYSKLSGSDDPEFTATVDGLLEGDEIRFTIVREEGEAPGTYAITPTGDEIQGNYQVVYHSGRLRIINNPAKPTPTPGPTPVVDEPKPDEPEPDPLVIFDPRGTGRAVWALVNLICLIITIYLFFPLLHLDAKFDRPRKMKKINKCKRQLRLLEEIPPEEVRDKSRLLQLVMEAREKKAASGKAAATGDAQEDEFGTAVETLFYQVKRFLRRFRIGMVLELIFSVLALVAFILTEDMRLPMVLIDRWTPLMILLMLIVWVLDVRLIRYRGQVLADEEEAERKRLEREQEAAQ